MKLKNLLSILLLLLAIAGNAQVGIGTASPNSALDIRSSNQATPANTDGILIPKIDAFPVTNPTVLQQGMLVYLTTIVGANQPGFYYWNFPALTWIGLGASTPGWSLTGNAATAPATNFLGTTDDKDIVFKRNNIRAGYIGDPVYAGVTYNNSNTSFGANSLPTPALNVALQRGLRNTAIGANVMPYIFNGSRNVGVGESIMVPNTSTSASENTAVGSGSLNSNTGNGNTAIGRQAMTSNTSGFNNTAIGLAALRNNLSGTNNVAVGNNAGKDATGNFNVFLGSDAGVGDTGTNKLYIESNAANATNPLVYGEFDNKKFRINGQVQVNGDPSVAGNGYGLPTIRGNANQVLTTNGAGVTSWAGATSALSVMRATLNFSCICPTGDQILNGTGWEKILFNTIVYDTNSEFNTTTNQFKPTKAGYYEIRAGYHIRLSTSTNLFSIGIRLNGTIYQQEQGSSHSGVGMVNRFVTTMVYLNGTTDYIEIYAEGTAAGVAIDSFPGKTFFEAIQIK